MTTTNMPTPGGVCREIPVLIEPVIRALSVPMGFRTVKERWPRSNASFTRLRRHDSSNAAAPGS
jgi:hypothetical protein